MLNLSLFRQPHLPVEHSCHNVSRRAPSPLHPGWGKSWLLHYLLPASVRQLFIASPAWLAPSLSGKSYFYFEDFENQEKYFISARNREIGMFPAYYIRCLDVGKSLFHKTFKSRPLKMNYLNFRQIHYFVAFLI
jgi:hypothetical protein